MVLGEVLRKARRNHPEMELGRLICSAVALSFPDKSDSAENKARLLDRIYSMNDKEMERVLKNLDRRLEEIQGALGENIEKVARDFQRALSDRDQS